MANMRISAHLSCVDVPENDVKSAMTYFENNSDYIKLPTDGEYVDGSFELSTDDPDEMEAMCTNSLSKEGV